MLIEKILLALLELHGFRLWLLVVLASIAAVGLLFGASYVDRHHVLSDFLIDEI